MFGLTKISFTKSRKIALAVGGVFATGAMIAIATQAKAQFRLSQVMPAPAPETPDAFAAPSQLGLPGAPPALLTAPPTPARPARRTRRIPIDPVPMPGDARAPLPELSKPLDIRTITGTAPTPISGISGKVMFTPICPVTAPSASCRIRPYAGPLKITPVARDRVTRLTTDPEGLFQISLAPGMYVIEPDSPDFPIGTGQTVTVIPNVRRQMEFNFQGNPAAAAVGATLPPLRTAPGAPGIGAAPAPLPGGMPR
jgi:hypothetical protein